MPYVPLTFSRHTLLAIARSWLFAFVHIRGVGPGRAVMNVLATLKVTALLVFIALGFSVGVGSSANLAAGGGAGVRDELAARARARDVHVLRMERRGVHGRGDSRSGAQRAARAR